MANHLRRQIREGIGTALTSLATTGARVFQSRVYPLQTAELPGLLIYTRSESAGVVTIHAPRALQRSLQIEVVAVGKQAVDLDDTLDQICKEVEIALADPVPVLAGLVKTIRLLSTEFVMEGDGAQPTGSATMLFEAEYFNLENAPDVAQ